jgi:hypothetical protein
MPPMRWKKRCTVKLVVITIAVKKKKPFALDLHFRKPRGLQCHEQISTTTNIRTGQPPIPVDPELILRVAREGDGVVVILPLPNVDELLVVVVVEKP